MLVFIALRLIALDQQYLLHDERDLSLTGYAIAHTGKDFMGVQFPLNFPDTNPNSPPVPYYFNALWWLLGFPLSVFTIRLPYVLFTSLLIPALFDIIFQLTGKRSYAWCSTLVFISSPWVFHITRLGLDSPLALTLTLIALSLTIRRRFVPSLIFFFLAINTYQAYRVVIPLLMLSVAFIQGVPNGLKRHFHQIFMWVVAVCIFTGITLMLNGNTISHRAGNELIFTNLDSYSSQIELDRQAADARPFIQSMFINKFTAVSNVIGQKLIDTLSPSFLFWKGDYSVTGSPFSGSFYFITLPFLFLGLAGLYQMEKRLVKIILVSLIVGWIPVAIHRGDTAIALRGSFMSIGFALLISQGLISSHLMLKSKTLLLKYMSLIVFIACLIANIATSAFTYYKQRPLQASEFFVEKERQIALKMLVSSEKHTVYAQIPQEVALAYQLLAGDVKLFMVSPISLARPQTFYSGVNRYVKCEGNARDFVNISKDVRIIERSCTDDLIAKTIEEQVGESNIVRTSDFSHLPVYYYIPAGVEIMVPRQS
jgi:4-amino-4-deoxy-L-arabinose transferase-like glycosyltransferase